jgi:hypothetical protein
VQCVGGLGKTALAHDFNKTAQLFEFHTGFARQVSKFQNGMALSLTIRF